MNSPFDEVLEAIEEQKRELDNRKRLLDEVNVAHAAFLEKLNALPDDMSKAIVSRIRHAYFLHQSEIASSETLMPETDEFVGLAALDCAWVILNENNNKPMHFSEIAKEALRRGYRGKKEGPVSEIEVRTIQSFWAALHRSKDYAATGKGYYSLVDPRKEHCIGPVIDMGPDVDRSARYG